MVARASRFETSGQVQMSFDPGLSAEATEERGLAKEEGRRRNSVNKPSEQFSLNLASH